MIKRSKISWCDYSSGDENIDTVVHDIQLLRLLGH